MTNQYASPNQATMRQRCNPAWLNQGATPLISVVVPFYRSDERWLAERIDLLARDCGASVCMIFMDDGSGSSQWADDLVTAAATLATPTMVVELSHNVGRARIRNHLCEVALSEYLVYLDSDMWPDDDDFLAKYVSWAIAGDADVIYGGRSAHKVTKTAPEYQLHTVFTRQREQLPAVVRRATPAYSFYSCNFLVRRSILLEFPLDARYTGWGWEDCEWAMRVSSRHLIRHEDNTASHLGLLTVPEILEKYDESVVNFSLFYQKHRAVIESTALVRIAKLAGALRLDELMRNTSRWLAYGSWLPIKAQIAGLMLYKAALYAPVVRRYRTATY